jgi:Tfp pilus assembly protein PilN
VTSIGTVSLLMIWIVLCMVIFAMLSLTTATRDYGFTQTLAQHTTDYYESVSQAQEQVAQLDELMAQAPAENYYEAIEAALPSSVTASYEGEHLVLSFQTTAGQSQSLDVSLRVYGPTSTPRYDIIVWRAKQTAQWQTDNTLVLLE